MNILFRLPDEVCFAADDDDDVVQDIIYTVRL